MSTGILGRPLPTGAAFTDLRIGMQARMPVTAAGPLALFDAIVPCAGAEAVHLEWDRASGDSPAQAVATIVRAGADPTGRGNGRVVQDVRLLDAQDVEVQRARVRWQVPNTEVRDDPLRTALEFGTVTWGRRIGERLATNAAFRSTTTPFDGAIGFSAGGDEVNFRIYRGKIVEVARKAVDGPTFSIDAAELTWLALLTAPTNDYVRRTMTNAFKVRGNGFQYVRMIKAIMLVLDEARAEVAQASHASESLTAPEAQHA